MYYRENIVALISDLQIYIEKHSDKHRKYNIVYNVIMFMSITFGVMTGIISLIRHEQILQYVSACLNFINSLLIAILKFKNFEEISIQHKNAAKEYLSLFKTLNNEIYDTCDIKKLNEWAYNRYEHIFNSSPFIVDQRIYKMEEVIDTIPANNKDEDTPDNNNNNNQQIATVSPPSQFDDAFFMYEMKRFNNAS